MLSNLSKVTLSLSRGTRVSRHHTALYSLPLTYYEVKNSDREIGYDPIYVK
jgi:hypothetical protein